MRLGSHPKNAKERFAIMKAIKKLAGAINSRAGSFIFFALSAAAFTFFSSSNWAYGWIAELYPLGEALSR